MRWLVSSISLLTQVKDLGDMRIKLLLHHLKEVAYELNITPYRWLESSISLLTGVGDLGDTNKVATSPPRGGGLRAQYRSSPESGTRVTCE